MTEQQIDNVEVNWIVDTCCSNLHHLFSSAKHRYHAVLETRDQFRRGQYPKQNFSAVLKAYHTMLWYYKQMEQERRILKSKFKHLSYLRIQPYHYIVGIARLLEEMEETLDEKNQRDAIEFVGVDIYYIKAHLIALSKILVACGYAPMPSHEWEYISH